MTEKERFSAAIAKMRAVEDGTVDVADWPGHSDRKPYRRAAVEMMVDRVDVPVRIEAMADLALAIGGYLTMHTYQHIDGVSIQVSVARDLDAKETAALAPGVTTVPLEAA